MSETTPETSELRDRLAGVLCPPHHREGFGGTITSADGTSRSLGSKRRPCLLHTAYADALLPVVAQEIAAAGQRGRAEAWDEGFTFGYWQERGYGVDEARHLGVSPHLRVHLGLDEAWEGDDDPDLIWNPYRAALAEPAAEEGK